MQVNFKADYLRLESGVLNRTSLRRRTAAVVGLGALGSEVCRLLGQMGVGRVLVIDPDVLGPENLPFGWVYRVGLGLGVKAEVGTGLLKAEAMAQSARAIFPDTAWESFPMEVADVGLGRLAEVEVIFSCTDNVLARAETSFLARLLGKLMVDGGLKGEGVREGRISLFPADLEAACYLCQMPERRRSELLAQALAVSTGCGETSEPLPMTATPAMASLVAGVMTDVGLRHILEPRAFAGSVCPGLEAGGAFAWVYRMPPAEVGGERVRIVRAVDCPWHEVERGALTRIGREERIGDVLREVSRRRGDGLSSVLELFWPICLRARCQACGAEQEERRRVLLLRRKGVCRACEVSGAMEPVRWISRIAEGDVLAQRTVEDTGLGGVLAAGAPDLLFWCRPEMFPSERLEALEQAGARTGWAGRR